MRRRRWLERLGLPALGSERAIWLLGDSRAAFEAAVPTIEALRRRQGRVHVLLSSGDPALLDWLAARFPECRAVALPLPLPPLVREYLHRSDIRLAAFIGGSTAVTPGLLAGLALRAVPVLVLDSTVAAIGAPDEALCRAADARLGIDGVPAVEAAVARFIALLGRDQKPLRGSVGTGFRYLLLRLLRHPRWRASLAWRLRRYDDLQALAAALDRPTTIMCLGNGPSSESPELGDMPHDSLFRVNHSWLKRGFLAAPDVVFAGGRPSFKAVRRAIFGLQSEDAEARFVAARLVDPRLGPAGFFNVHELAPALAAFDWGHLRPTNGATMIATAVALQPARLIVAGIDLFQHPAGSYPGDATTANAYSPAHTRESELAFLLMLFRVYEGELIIVGDILAEAWGRHRAEIGR